jgi:hypothetical protein
VLKSSIFGTEPPTSPPVVVTPSEATPAMAPMNDNQPQKTPQDELEDLENLFPSWAIALLVLGGTMVLFFAIVVWLAKKNKRQRQAKLVQQDPDLVAYTKMNV